MQTVEKATNQIMELPPATPSYLPRKEIEEFAEQISNEFSITNFEKEGDPLILFIKQLGGQIHYQNPTDFAGSEAGSIAVYGPNKFDVFLSAFTGPLRDRFTLAHELGHYVIHSKQGAIPLRAARMGSGQLEWEANWFAAAILMPSEEFKKVATQFGDDYYAIAGHFQVSTKAVEIRRKRIK
jgi:Zn-dependent peptidase ImmA (M78 family)